MKVKTFVPGHISCVFRPVRTDDILTTGSLGFGIRTDLGCTATVWEREDDIIDISINGKRCDASITRSAVESIADGRGFDIRLKHDLPLGQGFGASASGTYAATLCVADILGKDSEVAAIASHKAECTMGGGLGDLLAITSESGVPIRAEAGIPGKTTDSGVSLPDLTLIVFKEPLSTASVLSDEGMMEKIIREGDRSMEMFFSDRSVEGLFKASNSFSEKTGLEQENVRNALLSIRDEGYHAAMCMLGNSIYSTIPADHAAELFPEADIFKTGCYEGPISVRRI